MQGLFSVGGWVAFAAHAGDWLSGAAVQGPGSCPAWAWPSQMMGGSMGWFGGIFMIVFWLAVLVGIIAAARWMLGAVRDSRPTSYPGSPPPATDTPLDILKKRYARGELSKEQFESMKRDVE